MHHLLSAGIINTSGSLSSIILWGERSLKLILVLLILGEFLFKGKKSLGYHALEILVTIFLGVWVIPSMVPSKVSHIIENVNVGGAAGATGISWGMLGLLFLVAALVFFAYR